MENVYALRPPAHAWGSDSCCPSAYLLLRRRTFVAVVRLQCSAAVVEKCPENLDILAVPPHYPPQREAVNYDDACRGSLLDRKSSQFEHA